MANEKGKRKPIQPFKKGKSTFERHLNTIVDRVNDHEDDLSSMGKAGYSPLIQVMCDSGDLLEVELPAIVRERLAS